jgi:pimeloyl-ACP methyl ester carboxylesterase
MRTELLHDEGTGPPLVYVPGIDGSGVLLLETAERLRPHFRLIQVHYTPEGETVRGAVGDLVTSLVSVLDELGIDRALILAESFGGPVALTFAHENAERVRALTIVNSFAYFPQRARLAVSRFGSSVLPAALFEFVRPIIAGPKFFGRLCEPDALQRFKARETPNFDAAYRDRLIAVGEFDLRPHLPEIQVPVSLFASERDRIVPSVPCARTMLAGLPNASLRTIPNGGHVILPLRGLPWVEWLSELDAKAP